MSNYGNEDVKCVTTSNASCEGACTTSIVIKGEGVPLTRDFLSNGLFKQFFIPEVLCVPEAKPDIEEIMSVSASIEIISQRVIKTPFDTTPGTSNNISNEGQKVTGRKLVIEGILKQRVVYTAANAEQSVHSAHFHVPFSVFIVIDGATNLNTKYKIESFIEDLYICSTTPRQIFKNVTILIKATPLVCSP